MWKYEFGFHIELQEFFSVWQKDLIDGDRRIRGFFLKQV